MRKTRVGLIRGFNKFALLCSSLAAQTVALPVTRHTDPPA